MKTCDHCGVEEGFLVGVGQDIFGNEIEICRDCFRKEAKANAEKQMGLIERPVKIYKVPAILTPDYEHLTSKQQFIVQ